MSFMNPKDNSKAVTMACERLNVREWGVIEDDHLVHKATCRRCGDSMSSKDNYNPILHFKVVHQTCTGGEETY